jgi:hypothetical protein
MANPTAPSAVDDEKLADEAFNAGFALDTPPETTASGEAAENGQTPAAKTETKVAPKAVTPKAEPTPVAPKYVQITQEQFDAFRNAAAKTVEMDKQMSKAFGTMGQIQQVVNKLQSQTPAGMSIEVPKDAFADMEKDFPELAAQMRKGLEHTLKNVRGTGQRADANADPDAVKNLIHAATVKLEVEALEDAHPTWREIVGVVDNAGKHDPNNAFRQWLAKQDVTYQRKINATNSAVIVSRAIDRFLAATKAPARPPQTPAPKVAARNDRIRSALQPKGTGGQPQPTNTADDEFQAGFASG